MPTVPGRQFEKRSPVDGSLVGMVSEGGAEEVVVLDRERLGVLDASVALGVFGGLLWWSLA